MTDRPSKLYTWISVAHLKLIVRQKVKFYEYYRNPFHTLIGLSFSELKLFILSTNILFLLEIVLGRV